MRARQIYGIRSKINFRGLLKALALRNQKAVVTESEYEEFLALSEYMDIPSHTRELKALPEVKPTELPTITFQLFPSNQYRCFHKDFLGNNVSLKW